MPHVETARCSGHCCRAFVIPAIAELAVAPLTEAEVEKWTDPDIRARLLAGVSALDAFKAVVETRNPRYDCDEHRFIADMLIDLGREATIDPLTGVPLDPPQPLFGCRHYDALAGNCTVYEQRPSMCRLFPYDRGNGCAATGCTRKTEFVATGYTVDDARKAAEVALDDIALAEHVTRREAWASKDATDLREAWGEADKVKPSDLVTKREW